MSVNTKQRGFIFAHRFAIGFFLYVVLYNFLVTKRLTLWKVTNITYAYHLVDYKSFGFRSQLLPGSVFYGILGEHTSRTVVSIIETILLLLFFAAVAIILERFLHQTEKPYQAAALVLIFLYLSGPFTFSIFTEELGMLDVYWLFFSLLFFIVFEKKGLRFLIPVLFVLSLLVHFSSVLNDLILFSILLLYRISIESEKKTRRIYFTIFFLSILATAGLFIFFLIFHEENMPLSREAFHQLLQSRNSTYYLYYDYSFYNIYAEKDVVPSAVFSIESPVWRTIRMIVGKCQFNFKMYRAGLKDSLSRLALAILLLTPIMCFIDKHLHRFFKSIQGNKLKRFCVLLMMVQFPFTAVVGCLFSPDIIRWFTHAFLISFTMFLYVLHKEEDVRTQVLQEIDRRKNAPAAWIYFLAYFLVNSWAYC